LVAAHAETAFTRVGHTTAGRPQAGSANLARAALVRLECFPAMRQNDAPGRARIGRTSDAASFHRSAACNQFTRGEMKVLICYDALVVKQAVAAMAEMATVATVSNPTQEALLAQAADADFIVTGPSSFIDRNVIDRAGPLKLIARMGVGVDRIDLDTATARGIFVTNNPGLAADSVSELTVALLLAVAKNIPSGDRAVKEGRWGPAKEAASRDNVELCGMTHGVVGMGQIGSRVAAVCKALGMRVLYCKRNRNADLERVLGVEYAPFDKLIRESDTISLHTPLTDETKNLFDAPQFEVMKRTALLINQSRGLVVNEKALVAALREGKIAGYATDVYDDEPPSPDSELLQLGNVVAAAHVGALTRQGRLRTSMTVVEAMRVVSKGGVPNNLVNKAVLAKRTR
jgi:phosphoglycerate dehydrogenase-like enzyme